MMLTSLSLSHSVAPVLFTLSWLVLRPPSERKSEKRFVPTPLYDSVYSFPPFLSRLFSLSLLSREAAAAPTPTREAARFRAHNAHRGGREPRVCLCMGYMVGCVLYL